jgi:hypothetical protein
MRYSWQLLVVLALALSAFSFDNNSAAEQPATTAISTTTTIQPPTTTTPTPPTPTPTKPPGEPGPGGEQTPPKANKETSHEVAPGESLWTIAQNRLEEAAAGDAGEPTTDEVTRYWERVKAANQGRLASGDPDIIRTGETVILPPVTSSTAAPAPEARGETTRPAAPGDSLWTLARDHLAAVGSGEPSTHQVTAYWQRVKEANRHRLRSGDPDVIEVGEPIILPPVASAPSEPAPETRVQASRVVINGDNLWTIARDHLAQARGGGADKPATREVAAYWLRVVEANRLRLRSGDPDLIYPGERIVLPPVD